MPEQRLRTRFRTPEESTGLLLWRVTNRWQAAQRATLKPFGLTHVQFVLLASLTWLDGDDGITQRRLADHTGTDPMMTSQVLRTLEQRDLVCRAPSPSDRRAVLLSVTEAGRDLANRANPAVETCDAAFFASLGEDARSFTETLARLDGDASGFRP